MEKWLIIVIGIWITLMFGGLGVSEYQKNQCKISLAQAGRSVEDVLKVCK